MSMSEGFKYLGGGVVVYAIVAACGHTSGGSPSPDASVGGNPGGGGVFDAMTDPIADAHASAGAGGVTGTCGSCTVQGPISLSGPVKTLTADTDPQQAVGGTFTLDLVPQPIASGPFYLTDVRLPTSSTNNLTDDVLYAVSGTDCTASNRVLRLMTEPGAYGSLNAYLAIHGAHYFIAAGQTLCAGPVSGLVPYITWAGFHPYG
jgi:hypothetical protein